jgi:hypothetical protein
MKWRCVWHNILDYQLENAKLPHGSLAFSMCNVNEITPKICPKSNNFDNLEINDLLENIKILLDYIKKATRVQLKV